MTEQLKLNKLEKTICVLTGPVTGLIPPRLQMKLGQLTNNAYEAAVYMSTSSRIFNAAWTAYGLVSGVAQLVGVDLDPSPGNSATWASIPIGIDGLIREIFNGFRYAIKGGNWFTDYNIPWGEPVLSFIDSEKNPKFYANEMKNPAHLKR